MKTIRINTGAKGQTPFVVVGPECSGKDQAFFFLNNITPADFRTLADELEQAYIDHANKEAAEVSE